MGIDRYRARHTWGYMVSDLDKVYMDWVQCANDTDLDRV